MATTGTQEIVLITPGKIVGPGSEFEQQRLALRKEALRLVEESKKITVHSVESAEQATQAGRVLVTYRKELEAFFKGIKVQIDAVKKPVLLAENEDVGMLEAEGMRLGQELTKFNNEQRKIREEVERKAREAAEAAEREAQLQRAIEAEESGDSQQAEAILEEEVFVPVVVQAVTPPKVQGQVQKFSYAMEVTDLMALVKAVVAGTVPLQCITANESFLNGKARLEKEGYSVPGTRLVKKESTHFRS